eukprot:362721-Chlamydomonas_euryale.AAC.4
MPPEPPCAWSTLSGGAAHLDEQVLAAPVQPVTQRLPPAHGRVGGVKDGDLARRCGQQDRATWSETWQT